MPIDWTDQSFLNAINTSLTATAKCRGAFKAVSPNLGATTVVVPNILPAAPPLAYGPDLVESAVHVYYDLNVDEQQHAGDLPTVINLISAGATALGALEDEAIVNVPAMVMGGAAIVGRRLRQPAIPHGSLPQPGVRTQLLPLARAPLTGADVARAVSIAMAALQNANRPGTYSLILQNQLMSLLNLPAVAGAAPVINAISALIGGNRIVGTSALRGAANRNDVCGILFRFDPPAVDLVQTQLPALIVMGKIGGVTSLRIEESIAVRVLDPTAVHYLEY